MKKDETLERLSRSASDIFAFVNIISIASKTEAFRCWVKNRHGIKNDDFCFEGYKFFLKTAINCFEYSMAYDDSLEIAEDLIFSRARHQGIPIDEVPNTSEKTVLIKKIRARTYKMRTANCWKEIEEGIEEFNKIVSIFKRIYDQFGISNLGFDKDKALMIASQQYAYHYLNDCRHGYPSGARINPLIDFKITPHMLNKSYKGYVLTLQFVWESIIDGRPEDYPKIWSLHDANTTDYVTGKSELESIMGGLYESESEEKLSNENKKYEEDDEASIWYFALDAYSRNLYEETFKNYETEINRDFSFYPLISIDDFDKKFISSLISKRGLKNPEFMIKDDKKSVMKQLDVSFLYNEINVLDSKRSRIFNGVPAFVTLLVGAVNLRSNLTSRDKLQVIVFKHPDRGGKSNAFDYSFALYLETSSSIADYSGWLVFIDCAGDYSGFAGSQLALANFYIKQLKSQEFLT